VHFTEEKPHCQCEDKNRMNAQFTNLTLLHRYSRDVVYSARGKGHQAEKPYAHTRSPAGVQWQGAEESAS